MRIVELRWDEEAEEHIWARHRVSVREAQEAAYRHGLALRARANGVYEIYGRTEAGRYLMAAVRRVGKGVMRLITARDMSFAERRRYARYTAH